VEYVPKTVWNLRKSLLWYSSVSENPNPNHISEFHRPVPKL